MPREVRQEWDTSLARQVFSKLVDSSGAATNDECRPVALELFEDDPRCLLVPVWICKVSATDNRKDTASITQVRFPTI